MKTLSEQVPKILLFGVMTLFGVMNVSAGNGTELQDVKITSNQENQTVQQATKAKLGEVSVLEAKKSNVKLFVKDSKISSKKADKANEINKAVKKKQPSPSSTKSRAQSEGCFTDCLGNSVPPDVVLACADACAGQNYVGCAICIGVGVYVVMSCAAECLPLYN